MQLRWCLLFVPLLGFVCEQSFPPWIDNATGRTVEISGAFSDGREFEGGLGAGARLWAPTRGLQLVRLEVKRGDLLLFTLSADQIAQIQRSARQGQATSFRIERDGLHTVPVP